MSKTGKSWSFFLLAQYFQVSDEACHLSDKLSLVSTSAAVACSCIAWISVYWKNSMHMQKWIKLVIFTCDDFPPVINIRPS